MLPTKFQFIWQSGRRFLEINQSKTCLWQPYLLMNWDEISNLYRGPPIDASYHVSVHLVKRFHKSTNQKQELSVAAMFVNGSGRNEQS